MITLSDDNSMVHCTMLITALMKNPGMSRELKKAAEPQMRLRGMLGEAGMCL